MARSMKQAQGLTIEEHLDQLHMEAELRKQFNDMLTADEFERQFSTV